MLRERRTRRRTTLDEVIGCIPSHGPPISLTEMDVAVAQVAREMWDDFERQRGEE